MDSAFNVYKGLQKPLIFKGMKGNYIYYSFAAMMGGMVACIAVTLLVNFLAGGITLIVGVFGGIVIIALLQKGGLYKKDKKECIYIFKNLFING